MGRLKGIERPAAAGATGGTALALAGLGLVAAGAAVLLVMGRELICTCGYVKLWEGDVSGPGTSQHLADWYTPSHLIHGFIFYGLAHLALARRRFGVRLLAALVLELAWEIAENTNAVIERYRSATVSFLYSGDSVLNSLSDVGAMALGFWLASRLPVPVTVALAVAMELATGWLVRDNLTLNVLMLLSPLDAVRDWQAARG